MNKKNKKLISEVLDALCCRDPSWRHPRMAPKFKTLFDGWRAVEMRHNIHSNYFYSISWQRGWLPKADFERFRKYAMQ